MKKKILIFVHSFEMGGTQVNLLNTIKNLRKKFDFYIVVFKESQSTLERELKHHINNFFIFNEKIFTLEKNKKTIRKIKDIIEKVRPDLIETHIFFIDNPVREAAHQLSIKNVVVYQHGFGKGWGKTEKQIERQYIPITKKYMCVTKWNKKILKSIGVPGNKIIVLYNGINRKIFKKVSPNYQRGHIFKIGFVGRLEYSKNPLILPDIAEELIKKYGVKNFVIHVAGIGSLEKELKKKVGVKNLNAFFRFEGEIPRNKIIQLYKKLHLVLLPSNNESLPTAAIEATMIGLPVVAPDIAGLPELIIHGKTGFLVRKVSEYSKIISRMILYPRLYEKIVKNIGRQENRYTKQFSQKDYINKREQIWNQVTK